MAVTNKPQFWLILFVGALIGDIIGIAANMAHLHVFCKPLLMPLLIWGVLEHKRTILRSPWPWVVAGLTCSWLGDIFLLYEGQHPQFFIAGLGSFLLAHICYMVYYFKCGASLKIAFQKHGLWLLVCVAYTAALLWLLLPKLGGLQWPVTAYAMVLTFMLIGSIATLATVAKQVSGLFVVGAIFFVISDSTLAINKFYASFPLAGVGIMLTYGIAQLVITKAAIANKDIP